jgi:hypothetical protein
MDLNRKTLRESLFLFFLPLFLFIFTSLIFSNCARKKEKEKKQLVVIKDEFEKVEEFVLDEKTGQELAKNQILIYIVGNSKSELEEKKAKVSEFLRAKKGEFSVLGEIEFLSEKEKVGVLLQGRVPAGTPEEIKQIVSELRNFDGSIRAFPNMRMKPSAILGGYVPLDPLFDSWEETPGGNNWHFEAVNMPKLWNLETRGKVPVAVIDFGIRKHEDLEYDLRRGVDGEGADWAQNHGVSVLGVLGAVANNSKGIAGTIWRGDIKAYLIDGSLSSLVQSIVLALQDEAKVILFAGGLEWGSVEPEGNAEAEAILEYHREIFSVVFQYVRYYDTLFVQSAGNEGKDARYAGVGASVKDLFPQNILLVGSTNILGKISIFSNRGSLVDLYLPGESIFTTCAGGVESGSNAGYCLVNGTSYSAALGAGVAVLLRSINQNLKAGDIKGLILKGVRVEGEGENARYVIDFSISGNLAREAKPSEYDEFEPVPEIPISGLFAVVDDARGGVLGPKGAVCASFDDTTADGDPAFMAPKCPPNVEECSSCGLLNGNGGSFSAPEPNNTTTPYDKNTVFQTCRDSGNSAIRIISQQIESLAESGFFEPRKRVKLIIKIFCFGEMYVDVLTGIVYGSSTTFWYVGSVVFTGGSRCAAAGEEKVIIGSPTLPDVPPGTVMVVRARIQNSGNVQNTACYTASTVYDHDDLIFTVQEPAYPLGFTCGVYDSNFKAPVCYGDGWCGTCNLVPCRDTINDAAESPAGFFQCPNGTFPGSGTEPNQPNTLFSQCSDGTGINAGTLDEQVRRINIRSLAPSGKFEGGELVEVSVLVPCKLYRQGQTLYTGDQVILAYGSGVTYSPSPITNWRYLDTMLCGEDDTPRWYVLRRTFRLDNVEGWHAIRAVQIWCPGCSPVTGDICPASGNPNFRDADDFVFYVKAKPPSSLPVCAVYDNTTSDGDPAYKTPKCPAGADSCSTCDLIKSRDNISSGAAPEPNQPNTLFGSCADGGSGRYLIEESIERIEIKDLSGSGTFQPGASVEVNVLVYCFTGGPYSDTVEILYSPNADSPTFTKVATSTCSSGGGYYLHGVTITLGNRVGRHVIRAIFGRVSFAASTTCASVNDPNYGDTDDLVFLVGVPAAPSNFNAEGVSPDSITLSWSDVQGETQYELRWTDTFNPDFSKWNSHPASPLSADTTWYVDRPLPEGTQRCYAIRATNANGSSDFVWDCATIPSLSANCAVYDPVWRVPRCDGGINNCSTCDLVVSRDSLPRRQEINTPNAWHSSSCVDGTGGDWYSSRSIEKITLTTAASSFSPSYQISVTVRVFCSSTNDYVHLLTSGISTISWSSVGSARCTGSNQVEDKTFYFTPNFATWYVIRAVVKTGPTAETCPNDVTAEVDDIAVRVGGVPPVPSGFDVIFVSPDIARVVWSDVSGATYYQLVSAPSPSGQFTVDSDYSGSATYHDHSGLQDGQSLCFKVQACNALGCSAFTPVKCVTRAPRQPYSLSVTAYSTETITQYVVSFQDDSGNEDGFVIDRTSDGSSWTRLEWWSDSTTKTGTGSRTIEFSLSPETRWCFRVASFKQNAGGTLTLSSWADDATKCVIGVKAPSNLYVESTPVLRTLRFFWQDNSSYESGQNFEWRHSASSSYNQDSLGQNTAYYEKQFPSESVYCFRVTNWWSGDPSKPEEQGSYSQGYSGEVCKHAIGSPYPLYATFSSSGIRLDWQDNATSNVTYLIQVTDGTSWTTFQEVSSNTANYEFNPGAFGRYCYRVRVKSGADELWTSNVVCVNYGGAACSGVMTPLNVGVGSALKSVLSDGDMVFVAFADKVSGVSKPVVSSGAGGSATVKWSRTLGEISSNICSLSQDRIFIGDYSKIYVIRKGDGAILYERAFGPGNNGCAVSGGKIYLTTSTGYVWKLSPDLKVEGVANAGSAVATPVIDEREGGYIYVPRTDGVLKVYDLNLVEVGSVNLGSPITYVVLGPKRGEVFAAGEGGNYLYRVTRAGTSFFVKSVDVGGAIKTSPVVYQYGAEVTVIVGVGTGLKAYGVDSSGNFVELWSQSLGGVPTGAPVLAGDVVFIGVGDQIQARKISDGTPVGDSCPYILPPGSGNISTALDIDGSDIVFGDDSGNLYIISAGGGESKGWWVSYNMKGRRAIGGIYTHRGLAYEEARFCPYSPTSSGYIFSVIAEEIRSDYSGKEIFAFDNKAWTGYLISATGQIIWSAYLGWRSWSLPAVGDIIPEPVGEKKKEIAMGMEDARVVVLRSDGGWYQILLCGEIRAVTLADVDGNGDDEIIATSQGCNKTYVIDWDGASLKLLREYGLSSDSGNNSYAVVITYPGNSTIYVAGFSGNLYMFDYANYSTSVVSVAGSSVKLHTPAIGDVDGDGAKEVVVGGDNGVIYIRYVDGTSKGVVDITSYTGGVGKCMNRISLGDADRDGKDEIYVVASDCTATTGNSYLVSITHFGGGYQVRWGRGPFRGTSSSHVVIGDFDGDGMGDIATVVHYDDLYVWRWDGSMNFVGRAYYSGGGARGGMSVIDLDEDGRQNIIFGDRSSGCVHIFEFGEGTASGQVWWGYNRGNPKQNGVR